jgi:hypothetical protein
MEPVLVAETLAPPVNGDGWQIDADITKNELREFRRAGEQAVAQDNDELIHPWMARFVKAWPHALDPSDPDSYGKLKLSQWKEVVERVQAAFQAFSA